MKKPITVLTGSKGFIGQAIMSQWQSNDGQLIEWPGNILDDKTRNDFFQSVKPDVIIHLAGDASGSLSSVFANNVEVVSVLLSSAVANKVKHIVFASSCAVYGDTGSTPVVENHQLHPVNEYGLSKVLAERIINYYQERHQIAAVILRLGSVYGPHNNKGVVHELITSAQERSEIIIDGDGSQLRTFIHVSDVADAFIVASKLRENQTFNIGVQTMSLSTLASKVQEKYGGIIKYRNNENTKCDFAISNTRALRSEIFQPKYKQLTLC